MNLAHWLERSAAVFGDRPAIARGRTVVRSYREFAADAARCAGWLHEQGLVPGDRVTVAGFGTRDASAGDRERHHEFTLDRHGRCRGRGP